MRMTIFLDEEESVAIQAIAQQELRFPRDQVRFILRRELERRGLLTAICAQKSIGEASKQVKAKEVRNEQ